MAKKGSTGTHFEATQRGLEVWRERRKPGDRIPERLWARAVKLAGVHGVSKTAKELRLGFYDLRTRLERSRTGGETAEVQRFVELLPAPPSQLPDCVIEVEDSGGARLRIVLNGSGATHTAAVVSAAWAARSSR